MCIPALVLGVVDVDEVLRKKRLIASHDTIRERILIEISISFTTVGISIEN